MRKLAFALDADGFLFDFIAGVLRLVKEVTGRSYDSTDVGVFDFARALGLSADETREVKKLIARRGFCTSLVPYPGARQGVRRLRELGDVFCVTAPWDSSPWWEEERSSSLALHFGIDVVHHADDKSRYEADVFVDDRAKHVSSWLAAWPRRCAVFWRTPQNASEPVPAGAHSLSSWDALYDVAREFALGSARPSLSTLEVAQ